MASSKNQQPCLSEVVLYLLHLTRLYRLSLFEMLFYLFSFIVSSSEYEFRK